ncbi:MAG: hypothetical protein KGL95_04230 [Patescibacteria group bacterium]|nr:hypothetical protein [Patescibacteria group bacterium]
MKLLDDRYGNKQSPRFHAKAKRLTVIFLIGIITIITVFTLSAMQGQFNMKPYYPTPLKIPLNITLQNLNKTIELHAMSVVWYKTTSSSAQNPIDMYVQLYPEKSDLNNRGYDWKNLPDKQIILFDGASVYPREYTKPYNFPIPAYVVLKKYDNTQTYFGFKTLIYESEGKHGYFYLTEMQQKAMTNLTPIIPNSIQMKEMNHSSIEIDSSDQTSTVESNNFVLALTLVLIGFGFVELRKEITNIIEWVLVVDFKDELKKRAKREGNTSYYQYDKP